MFENKRILVTGGSGFMGTHLVKQLLENNVEVLNFDRKAPVLEEHMKCWCEVDLLDKKTLEEQFSKFKPHFVVHLAARTDLDEKASLSDYDDNIGAVENILECVESCDETQRILVTSSMLVCGIGYKPESDTDYDVSTVYGESKVLTEKITRKKNLTKTWSIIRPATIWGAYHFGLKAGFFSVLSRGLYLHPGSRTCFKSYGYVENSVYQIINLLLADEEKVNKKVFYISDEPMNLLDWVNEFSVLLNGKKVRVIPIMFLKILALFGDFLLLFGIRKFPMSSFRLTNMTTENIVDTEGIFLVTGKPPITMTEGVKRTVKWLRSVGL